MEFIQVSELCILSISSLELHISTRRNYLVLIPLREFFMVWNSGFWSLKLRISSFEFSHPVNSGTLVVPFPESSAKQGNIDIKEYYRRFVLYVECFGLLTSAQYSGFITCTGIGALYFWQRRLGLRVTLPHSTKSMTKSPISQAYARDQQVKIWQAASSAFKLNGSLWSRWIDGTE